MIDNRARALLPPLAGPVVRLYARLGLSPNAISFIGFGVAVAAASSVALGLPLLAIGLWWLSRLADGTDGIYARERGLASDFGAYLDMVLDMAAYSLMIVGFAIAEPTLQGRWLVIVVLYVLCITSALALGMQEQRLQRPPRDNRGLRLGAGLAEGGETGIAYTLFLLFPGVLETSTAIWIAVLVVTVVARTVLAYRILAPFDAVAERAPESHPADLEDSP